MVDGLDREQQADVLQAYGLDEDEREKFMNGQLHLLSFLDKNEEKNSGSKDNAGEMNKGVDNPANAQDTNKASENTKNNTPTANKDLRVALAARQALLNQINSNDNELYQDLVKRYNSIRTGNYSEEQKNNYYAEFEKEIEKARNSDRLNRGKLNMSERVCNILATGQKIQLPIFEKDNLTLLGETIKKREAVVEASVQAARQEEKRKEDKEKLDNEIKAVMDEMAERIHAAENVSKQINTLKTDGNKFVKEEKQKDIKDYRQEYYKPRREQLEKFRDELNEQQRLQSENFRKMDELRNKLNKFAAQADTQEEKDQFDELFKQHDTFLSNSYDIMGYELEDSLDNALEALEIDSRTTKNNNLSEKISSADKFANGWLDDYEKLFREKPYLSRLKN